jgi:hypothetical protein
LRRGFRFHVLFLQDLFLDLFLVFGDELFDAIDELFDAIDELFDTFDELFDALDILSKSTLHRFRSAFDIFEKITFCLSRKVSASTFFPASICFLYSLKDSSQSSLHCNGQLSEPSMPIAPSV